MSIHNGDLPGPDNIMRAVLDNGITTLVYENFAAQSVVIAGYVAAGSIYEQPVLSGLAGMTAGSLMRGTERRDFETIHASLEDIGADLDTGVGAHHASFSGKALAEDLPTLIEILSDVLRRPIFPNEQIERLRGEILTSLHYRQHDTRYRANRAFRESLYTADHPYHYSSRGSLQSIPQIQVADLQQFHARHYGPQGMIVVIVGAVRAGQAIDTLRRYLGDWHNPDQPLKPTLPAVAPPQTIRRVSVTVPGKSQSDIMLGVIGPTRRAPDYRAATVVNSILGQFGLMGRIGAEVREKLGLAYYASSSVEGGQGPGPWSITAGVNPANVQPAIDAILNEIRRITTEAVSAEDLADNQSYFTGSLPLQLESNEGIAGSLLNMETFDLGLDYLRVVSDEINALTCDDLLAAAQRYWNPDAFVLAVAGPG
jgi:zinc protease